MTAQELDQAIAEAVKFVDATKPLFSEAKKFGKDKPGPEMVDPSEEILEVYKQLREAEREVFKLGKHIEVLESRMKIFIGENRGINGLATWKWKTLAGMNVTKFKAKEKKLYEQYLVDRGRREFKAVKADLTKLSGAPPVK